MNYEVGISVKIQPNKWYVYYYSDLSEVFGAIKLTNEFQIIKIVEVSRPRGAKHILVGKAMTFNFVYDYLPLTFCEVDTTHLIQNHYKDVQYWEFCLSPSCFVYLPIEQCGF